MRDWRRGWDSNPRYDKRKPLFESGTFSHSVTSPSFKKVVLSRHNNHTD